MHWFKAGTQRRFRANAQRRFRANAQRKFVAGAATDWRLRWGLRWGRERTKLRLGVPPDSVFRKERSWIPRQI